METELSTTASAPFTTPTTAHRNPRRPKPPLFHTFAERQRLHIHYKTPSLPSVIHHIIRTFLAHILFVRGQLPRQLSDVYELAKSKDMKHARMGHGHAVEGGCHEEQGNRAGRRRVMSQQERRDASKALRERRRALKFFKSINPFFEGIRGLDNEKLKVLQVLVLLGSSIHNPREAFLLTLPERGDSLGQCLEAARLEKVKAAVSQKFVLAVLRSFPMLSEKKTSFKRVHLLIRTRGSSVVAPFLPKAGFSLDKLKLTFRSLPVHEVTVGFQQQPTNHAVPESPEEEETWMYYPSLIKGFSI